MQRAFTNISGQASEQLRDQCAALQKRVDAIEKSLNACPTISASLQARRDREREKAIKTARASPRVDSGRGRIGRVDNGRALPYEPAARTNMNNR